MALTANGRNVPRHSPGAVPNALAFPQKGATSIYRGALCVLNAGYLAPGTVATGLIAVGVRCKEASVNAGADGAVKDVEVEAGIFPFKNSGAGDAIAQADVGADCYIVDDETVAKTNGTNTRSRAGKIVAVDANWVWVIVGITV